MRSCHFAIFADYFQFCIQDEAATGDLSSAWSEEAIGRMLAVAPGVVGVGTVRNMTVPVTVELHDTPPQDDFADWDCVAEASLEVTSDRIAIAGCTDYLPDAARIELAPGHYRVRASFGSLTKLSDDGLEGEDHYRLQLWRALAIAPCVVKPRVA